MLRYLDATPLPAEDEPIEPGTGELRRVRDTRLGRTVRLRTFRPPHENAQRDIERALAQWAVAGSAGCAALYDTGFDGGALWWVSEHLPGPTLAAGSLTPADAADLLRLMRSLHAANGVVGGAYPERIRRDAFGRARLVEVAAERSVRAPARGPCIVDRTVARWMPLAALRDPSRWSRSTDRWNLLSLVCWGLSGVIPDRPEMARDVARDLCPGDGAQARVVGAAFEESLRDAEAGRSDDDACPRVDVLIDSLLAVRADDPPPHAPKPEPQPGTASPAEHREPSAARAPEPDDDGVAERVRAKLARYETIFRS